MQSTNFLSRSPTSTRSFAAKLALQLKAGDVVSLVGDLGAGKTEFVRGLCSILVPDAEICSPSFVRLHAYGGSPPVYHADFYLAKSEDDVLDYGLDEIISTGGIVLVEWGERFIDLLPPNAIWIYIDRISEHNTHRSIRLHRGNPSIKSA
jgi:tRNA threonylcarbamoyladenosine biosynthesis protein TsaE